MCPDFWPLHTFEYIFHLRISILYLYWCGLITPSWELCLNLTGNWVLFKGGYFTFLLNTGSKKLCIWGEYKGVRLIAFPTVTWLFLWNSTLQKATSATARVSGPSATLETWMQEKWGVLIARLLGKSELCCGWTWWFWAQCRNHWEVGTSYERGRKRLAAFLMLISHFSISISANSSGMRGK